MANDVLYSVDVTLTDVKTEKLVSFCFRNSLPIEQAVDLARSLWLSTNDNSVAVYVRDEKTNICCISFRSRE